MRGEICGLRDAGWMRGGSRRAGGKRHLRAVDEGIDRRQVRVGGIGRHRLEEPERRDAPAEGGGRSGARRQAAPVLGPGLGRWGGRKVDLADREAGRPAERARRPPVGAMPMMPAERAARPAAERRRRQVRPAAHAAKRRVRARALARRVVHDARGQRAAVVQRRRWHHRAERVDRERALAEAGQLLAC